MSTIEPATEPLPDGELQYAENWASRPLDPHTALTMTREQAVGKIEQADEIIRGLVREVKRLRRELAAEVGLKEGAKP